MLYFHLINLHRLVLKMVMIIMKHFHTRSPQSVIHPPAVDVSLFNSSPHRVPYFLYMYLNHQNREFNKQIYENILLLPKHSAVLWLCQPTVEEILRVLVSCLYRCPTYVTGSMAGSVSCSWRGGAYVTKGLADFEWITRR